MGPAKRKAAASSTPTSRTTRRSVQSEMPVQEEGMQAVDALAEQPVDQRALPELDRTPVNQGPSHPADCYDDDALSLGDENNDDDLPGACRV